MERTRGGEGERGRGRGGEGEGEREGGEGKGGGLEAKESNGIERTREPGKLRQYNSQ